MLQEHAKAVFYWNMSLQIRVVFYWQTLFGAFCCFLIPWVCISFLLWPRSSGFGWFACWVNIRMRSALLCGETKFDKQPVFTSSRLFIEVFCQTSSRLACTTASFCKNVLASLHTLFFLPSPLKCSQRKILGSNRIKASFEEHCYASEWSFESTSSDPSGHFSSFSGSFEDSAGVQKLCWQLISNAPTSKLINCCRLKP